MKILMKPIAGRPCKVEPAPGTLDAMWSRLQKRRRCSNADATAQCADRVGNPRVGNPDAEGGIIFVDRRASEEDDMKLRNVCNGTTYVCNVCRIPGQQLHYRSV